MPDARQPAALDAGTLVRARMRPEPDRKHIDQVGRGVFFIFLPKPASPLLKEIRRVKFWGNQEEMMRMSQVLKAVSLAALLAAAPLTMACSERPADQPDYQARVNDQLKAANLDGKVKVDWKADDRILELSGEVERAADKARAEELAQQVVGTAGRVVNEVKVEGMDYADVDNRIEDQLDAMFEDRTEWDFDGRGVSFDAEQGVVTITGTVESEATKTKIGERARAVSGVKDVVNKLDVDPKRRVNPRDRT